MERAARWAEDTAVEMQAEDANARAGAIQPR